MPVEQVSVRPQRMQMAILSSEADIVIAGGAAGAGKTYALLLEPLRHAKVKDFDAVIFRRTMPEISNPGGMWDESEKLYPQWGATPRKSYHEWIFPAEDGTPGAKVRFAHMEHESTRLEWQGSQVPLICFDQLELFTAAQFWFMFSRLRSVSGVPPYLRGSCNPVVDDDPVGGWLHRFLQWWIDEKTGFPIPERAGVIRWFLRIGEALEWADTAEDLIERFPTPPGEEDRIPKSVTFIPGKLEDNPALTSADPNYRANLEAMPLVERERLLGGNWNVRPTAGKVFNREWFPIVEAPPAKARRVRAWDKGATPGSGDPSAGVKVSRDEDKVYYIEHAVTARMSSLERNKLIKHTASVDGTSVRIILEQEPGSGGKESAEISVRDLEGYRVTVDKVTGDKLTRAGPLSSAAENGNVRLVRGPWNQAFLDELHAFDGRDGGRDDQVDSASAAYNHLANSGGFEPFSWSFTKSTDRRDQGARVYDPRYGPDPVIVPRGYSERGDMKPDVAHVMNDDAHRSVCRQCSRDFLKYVASHDGKRPDGRLA